MRLDLGAQAQGEASPGVGVEVVADIGHVHRCARQCNRNGGTQLDTRGMQRGHGQRHERVVGDFRHQQAIVAQLFQLLRLADEGVVIVEFLVEAKAAVDPDYFCHG